MDNRTERQLNQPSHLECETQGLARGKKARAIVKEIIMDRQAQGDWFGMECEDNAHRRTFRRLERCDGIMRIMRATRFDQGSRRGISHLEGLFLQGLGVNRADDCPVPWRS